MTSNAAAGKELRAPKPPSEACKSRWMAGKRESNSPHTVTFTPPRPIEAEPSISALYYRAWAIETTGAALPLGESGRNSDADPRSDLLEYAFGGHPTEDDGERDGVPLDPQVEIGSLGPNEFMFVSFLRRTDATARGLQYLLQFSHSISESDWVEVDTPGFEAIDFNPTPVTEGFERVRYRLASPIGERPIFARVGVSLVDP